MPAIANIIGVVASVSGFAWPCPLILKGLRHVHLFGPVHFYDSAFTLTENLFGRSRTFDSSRLMCDCAGSYLASAFAPGLITLACLVVAILAAISIARRRKWSVPLAAVWLALLGYSFWRELGEKAARIEAAGPASQILDDYGRMFLTAAPIQLLFDLVLLFAIPVCITLFAMRKPRPSVQSI